ncbi:uncharacterized protein LOC120289706 [Eucalyptus grandis]|uniref:uncharacterized protein LOC120289706 n=1 Tax=Eucalyptus grandis TaxID=71139 RepID=UPI00192F0A22|nr:uncharacterized protein LOC120289706 [Eucalyptus grandis]
MDVKLSIGGEDVGMNKSIKEEVQKDEGGASMELLENKMDSLEEEEIWKSRRERMNNALAAAQATGGQDSTETYAAARKLADVIERANVEEFISAIEGLPNQTDLFAIFNFLGLWSGSLLHIAAATKKDDTLWLLLAYVSDHFIAAQNEWGDTPLHMAARAGGSRATVMLIRRASNWPNVEDKNRMLRMQNKHGNTALHEAVLKCHVHVVRFLLKKDLEPVYLKNKAEKSPLYLALDTKDSAIHKALFTLLLEPSRIEGLPPIHGVILHRNYAGYIQPAI